MVRCFVSVVVLSDVLIPLFSFLRNRAPGRRMDFLILGVDVGQLYEVC